MRKVIAGVAALLVAILMIWGTYTSFLSKSSTISPTPVRSAPSNVTPSPLRSTGGVWSLLGPGDADWTTVIAVSKRGIVYAGFDIGGIYKSADRGASWIPINNGITNYYIYDIVVDPNDERVLWAGTRGAIFKSTDGGASWTAKRNGIGGPSGDSITAPISSVIVDPHNSKIVYAGVGDTRRWQDGHGTVYKSTDAGGSWTAASVGSETNIVTRLAIDPRNPDTLYAATEEGLFKSTDGGRTWQVRKSGLKNTSVQFIAVAPSDPSVLYLTVATRISHNAWNGGVYKSTDAGQRWKRVNGGLSQRTSGGGDNYNWLAIDPSDPNLVYVANSSYLGSNGVWKSADGGASWIKSTRWKGENGSNTTYGWRPQFNLNGTTLAVDPGNPSRIYMGSTSQIIKSENGGKAWEQIYTRAAEDGPTVSWANRGLSVLGAARVTTVDPSNSKVIFIGTGDHGLLKSEDGGSTWRLVSQGTGVRLGFDVPAVVVDPVDSAIVWAADNAVLGENSGGVVKSGDHGESWTEANEGLPDAPINCLVLDPGSPPESRVLYAISQGYGVYKSDDGGENWSAANKDLPENELVQLAINPSDPRVLYAAVQGTSESPGGVWKTDNGGLSWFQVNTGSTLADVRTIAVDPTDSEILYAGLRQEGDFRGGVYKSADGGTTWTVVLDETRIETIVALPGGNRIIYAATQDDNYHDESSGRGIYRSADGGDTWSLVNDGLAVLRFWSLSFDPNPPYPIYASSNGSGVYVTVDPLFQNGS